MWTQFMDMHSGGGQKLEWSNIYIEAPEDEARAVFYSRFGRDPDNVTCECCGSDYSLSSEETLLQASGFDRNCDFAYFDHEGNELTLTGWNVPKLADGSWPEGRYVERGRNGNAVVPLEVYCADPDVHIIRSQNIAPHERDAM
jgi:hypothetical protein